ncbi:MAG: YceI family protein [Gemmatimonadaceae bacterium]
MTSVQPATSTTTTWKLDPSHSDVSFSAKHMMITTVRGRFSDVSGTIALDESDITKSRVEATLGAASIDTRVEQRDAHLKSADFLDIETHPSITFTSTEIEAGDGEFTVTGTLTIRGVAKPISLLVTSEGRSKDPWGGERIAFSASAKLDRREFGLLWNQALEAGGVLVSNEIRIVIEAQAVKQG